MVNSVDEHPLRKWRKSKGLTLHQAAEAVGTVRQVWSDWERGRRRPGPSYMPRVRELTEGAVTADAFYPEMERKAA
jgi:transcriptional regulator with XRE-family HTH domain